MRDDDEGLYRGVSLAPDEMYGGRRRLRRAILLAAVLAATVLAYGLATMMRG